jgi:hypothetical protein
MLDFGSECVKHIQPCVSPQAWQIYCIFPSITGALSIQKRSVNGKNDGARYTMNARNAIKIKKKFQIIYIPMYTII